MRCCLHRIRRYRGVPGRQLHGVLGSNWLSRNVLLCRWERSIAYRYRNIDFLVGQKEEQPSSDTRRRYPGFPAFSGIHIRVGHDASRTTDSGHGCSDNRFTTKIFRVAADQTTGQEDPNNLLAYGSPAPLILNQRL